MPNPTPEKLDHVLSFRMTIAQYKKLEALAKTKGYPWTPATIVSQAIGKLLRATRAGIKVSK